jgi:hypothetical protein
MMMKKQRGQARLPDLELATVEHKNKIEGSPAALHEPD